MKDDMLKSGKYSILQFEWLTWSSSGLIRDEGKKINGLAAEFLQIRMYERDSGLTSLLLASLDKWAR